LETISRATVNRAESAARNSKEGIAVNGVSGGACVGAIVATGGVDGELAGGVAITDAGAGEMVLIIAVGDGISVGMDVGAGVSSPFISFFIGNGLPSRAMIAHTVIKPGFDFKYEV
jgi:hypothetical protein